MKWLCIYILLSIHLVSYSQNTFSKVIDLGIALNNELTDLEISDEFLYVSALHLCHNDTTSNVWSNCTSISKYSVLGDLNNVYLLDSFTPEGRNRLLLSDEAILLTGHWHEPFDGRPTILLRFNHDLEIESSLELASLSGEAPNNEGIIELDNDYYVYGDKLLYSEGKKYSQIMKIDKDSDSIVWDKLYSRGDWENDCNDLQSTKDGNLIYVNYFLDDIGAGGDFGYQIVKINTSGQIVATFEFEDLYFDNPRLLASSEGDIYFSSENPPYHHVIPSNGRINKINPNLDTLEWSLELPSDPFINGRKYKIYDYTQARNGDIIACGTVWDEGPDGPLETNNNHTWNGFIVRVSQGGELKWLRIYRHPNMHPELPRDTFGEFRPSLLSKIYEITSGSFIVGGTVYYNGVQDSALPFEESKSEIWLMNVDEKGCIESEECSETIVLNGKNDLTPNFKIGTFWVYEVNEAFPNKTSFQTFEITDTTIIVGKKAFIIENDYDNSKEYMNVEGPKIYFWDNQMDTFQLNYDFNENIQYESPWQGICIQDSGIAIIRIDSITSILLNSDTVDIQHLTISENGVFSQILNNSVYKNIGLSYGGIVLPLGQALCDYNRGFAKLRCFGTDSINYNFVDYPCDSIWLSTTTSIILDSKPIIYPNPSNGILQIQSPNIYYKFELYNLDGKLLQKNEIVKNEINIAHKGLFCLKIFDGTIWLPILILVI